MDETTSSKPKINRAPSYGLLYFTRAYNRQELSLDEWLGLSRDWAERIIRQASVASSTGLI